jgi:hypothetical protein
MKQWIVKAGPALAVLCIAILAGCESSTQKQKAAMPLKGVRVVVADEFDSPAPWKPDVLGSMDYALISMIKTRYNWGLAAAQDLTNALAKVTGGEVPLYFERDAPLKSGPVIYLGPVRAASAAGIDGADMMAGEWRIECDGKRAFIFARTTMGAAYGVTDFLAKYANYHFVTIEGDDPYVVNPAAAVPVVDFRAKHAVYARHYSVTTYLRTKPWLAGTSDMLPAYMRRTGSHVTPEIEGWVRPSLACGRHCHTFFSHLSPKEYFKKHPEYFSMDYTGRRVPRMLCLSNPDVKRIVTGNMLSFIGKDRAANPVNPPTLYDFSQEDSCEFLCHCPECKKIIAKYGGDSGLLLWFVNDLARAVRVKYPDVTIRTFAYVSTEAVPIGIKPEPNIMFWLCDLYSKCDHELPLSHPLNARYRKLFKDWSAFAPKLEIWDYMLSDETFPEVSVDAIASDTRYFRDLGINRIYRQNPFGGQPLWELDMYVCSKFFRDPNTDLEKAVDEYCAVYGKGARQMRAAIDYLRGVITKNPPGSVDAWHIRALPWRNRAVMEKFRDLVRLAHDAEDAPRSRTRTALALRCVSRELMRIANNKGDVAACEAAKRDFLAASEELGDKRLFSGVGKAKLMACSRDEADLITFRFKRLPKGLESVPAGEMHCLDIRSCMWISANTCKKVADPASECPLVVRAKPDDPAHVLDWALVRDKSNGRADKFQIKLVKGEGYRWYRLGVSRVARAGDCFLPVHMSFATNRRYVECDGLAEDPNWYEFWLSVKYNGDPFSKNEKEGLFIDRLLLRRVRKP